MPSVDSQPLAIRTRVVVIATGLADHVRVPGPAGVRQVQQGSRIGVGGTLASEASALPTGELVMAVGQAGYCGIVRLEDGRIDVAAAVDRQTLAKAASVGAAVVRILGEADATGRGLTISPGHLATATFRATPALTHAAPLVAGASRRIFRVGDAAGYVEPFTGEGIGWALSSSRLLATALLDSTDPASVYASSHAAYFHRLHGRCRRIAAALRHPRLVGTAIRLASAAPWAAGRMVPLLVGAAEMGDDAS